LLGRGITLFVALSLLAAGCGSSDNGRSESAGQSGALEFVANPSTVTVGANTWLSWSGRDATSCQASGGWTGERPASGGFRTPPLTQTTTYTLNCTGPGRGSRARVKVVVSGATGTADGAPQVSLRSQAGSIPSNGSTVLEWTAPTAGQCTASGGWSGKKPNRGSQRITGLTADSTFTLSCDGPGGTGIAMTQVMLQRATLRWAGSNVDNLAAFRILWGKVPTNRNIRSPSAIRTLASVPSISPDPVPTTSSSRPWMRAARNSVAQTLRRSSYRLDRCVVCAG
jgi:hypothetical protein